MGWYGDDRTYIYTRSNESVWSFVFLAQNTDDGIANNNACTPLSLALSFSPLFIDKHHQSRSLLLPADALMFFFYADDDKECGAKQ